MRLKLDTMTGTGRAMTKTPLSEQTPPTILPIIVAGTMSPYLLVCVWIDVFVRQNVSLSGCLERRTLLVRDN